jgi:hypothetical protein
VRLDGSMQESIAHSLRHMTGTDGRVDEDVREARPRAGGGLAS